MHRLKVVATVAALANYAAVMWHLYLAAKLNPALTIEQSVRIASFAGALTFVGLALLWARWPRIGSLVLAATFANGLVLGTIEHFFVTGPNNVFDVGDGDWALPFKISVAILIVFEVAGLSASGRMLLGRSPA